MSQSDGMSDGYEEEGACQPGNENTGRWTSDEHRLFLKGLERYGKGWKQIATLIQTRTVVQIRTHAQKYFQKLSKVKASGNSCLDPATLMNTMDAGKMRTASVTVPRNLRSSNIGLGDGDVEGRLRSLRKRRNGSRDQSDAESDGDDDSGDDISMTTNCRRGGESSEGSSQDEGEEFELDSEQEEEDEGEIRQKLGQVEIGHYVTGGQDDRQQGRVNSNYHNNNNNNNIANDEHVSGIAPVGETQEPNIGSTDDSNDGDDHTHHNFGEEEEKVEVVRARNLSFAARWRRKQAKQNSKVNRRSSPAGKASKTNNSKAGRRLPPEGGAADARALAWEAATSKAASVGMKAEALAGVGDGTRIDEVARAKRSRADTKPALNRDSLSISGAIKDTGTRISPTSVADVNFMSFSAQHHQQQQQQAAYTGALVDSHGYPVVAACHQLPHQLAPSWCTKPQDTWKAPAGFDAAIDADDAGPFRWFIDERSVSAPGAFFQSPVEASSGSDTTDVSTSVGVSSGGEGIEGEHCGKRDSGGVIMDATTTSCLTKRRCTDPVAGAPATNIRCSSSSVDDTVQPGAAAATTATATATAYTPTVTPTVSPVCDAAMAHEVNRHVEADSDDDMDITSGLWVDHPQDNSSLMCGLGLQGSSMPMLGDAPAVPSLNDDEVLGFLSGDDHGSSHVIRHLY